MVKILHVRLEGVEILHGNGIEEAYFSVTHEEKQYFSGTFDHQNTRLQDDLLLRLENGVPDSISLQRWENCMVVFSFDLELPELRTRGSARRKVETRQLEILSLSFSIYEEKEVLFSDKYLESISQHYLIIEDIAFVGQPGATRAAASANYFTVKTQNSQFMLPVRGGHILVRLPETIEIASFVNNCFAGKSAVLGCDQLKNGMEVDLNKTGKGGRVAVRLRWAINLHKNQAEQNLLMEVNELLFYDV